MHCALHAGAPPIPSRTMVTAIHEKMLNMGVKAREASRVLMSASDRQKSQALLRMAQALQDRRPEVEAANRADVEQARQNGLDSALLDRLTLSERSVALMAAGLAQIAAMPDPVGMISNSTLRPNGMRIAQMRVPLGVVGIIYESRPNVTIDAASLCLKSGNAAILRGGSEALRSNTILGQIIAQGLGDAGLPQESVQVVDTPDRAAVGTLITMTEHVDVIIPRGGKGLIARLAADARVPMIKHLEGNCHVYIDAGADAAMAHDVAFNAKTYRYGICGAMETLLVDQAVARDFLPSMATQFRDKGVELRGCERTRSIIDAIAATEEDWHTEYLAPILSIRVVDGLDQAIEHINHYGSHHTDSIVSEHQGDTRRFVAEVDSSSVMINTPTCFADGFEYGLGAEIGISTDKLHARGPVGLEGLTCEKYVVVGDGQLRGQASV